MKNWPLEDEAFILRLSGIEASLNRLEADFESTTWRKSSLVASCIKSARAELKMSLARFVMERVNESAHLANLAWLHVEFGRKLIDAETTEGILGEGRFLELTQETTTSALLVKYFGQMEQRIINLRETIKKQAVVPEQ